MDGKRSFLTCCYGVDGELGSGINVSADEDVGFCSLLFERICYSAVSSAEFHLGALKQIAPDDALSYGKDDVFALYCHCIVLIVFR